MLPRELLEQFSKPNAWVEINNPEDIKVLSFNPARYAINHSLMKPHEGTARQEIINNVHKSMQLIRFDFEYETVRKFVNNYLDKVGFKENICNDINPNYIGFVEV